MDAARRTIERPAIESWIIWMIRGLMVILVLSSIFGWLSISGIDVSGFLYEFEITRQFYRLLNGRMVLIEIVIWSLVIISHAFIVALIFLVGHRYFYRILVWAPIVYILFNTLNGQFAPFLTFGLIPFIILWIISLVVCWQFRYRKVNQAEHVQP